MKESLKPIEPGCMAIILHISPDSYENHPHLPFREGEVVTVVRKTWRPGRCSGCGQYDGRWQLAEHADENGPWDCCTCGLLRIDPDDDIKQEEDISEPSERLSSGALLTITGAFDVNKLKGRSARIVILDDVEDAS